MPRAREGPGEEAWQGRRKKMSKKEERKKGEKENESGDERSRIRREKRENI